MNDLENGFRKIFIGGLSYATDDEKLREYFSEFGPVQDAVVMKDPITRRSRGFGFITFEDASFVDVALAQDVHTIDLRKVSSLWQLFFKFNLKILMRCRILFIFFL